MADQIANTLAELRAQAAWAATAGSVGNSIMSLTTLGDWPPSDYEAVTGERWPEDHQLPPRLNRIIRAAKRDGVVMTIWDGDERIELRWLTRRRGERNPAPRGSPVRHVWALCDYADRHRRPIWLEVIDGPKLVRYYRQFGFHVSRDYGNREDYEMIREPR